jgi:hypothetical protein
MTRGVLGCASRTPQTGMSYAHLLGVANASEPMTTTDARDLAAALDVPQAWLRDGWNSSPAT